ncbi:hypothetical protein KKC17_01800 [Patescibacteria group bacterium]|nr:hypothetical protein [Patescibacteria group bacterium]
MYLTIHAAAGLTLAKYIPNPFIAFIAGVLSHLILDAIPHGDEYLNDSSLVAWLRRRRFLGAAILDSVTMLGFVLLYLSNFPIANNNTVLAAVFGALLPDIVQGLHFLSRRKWLKKYHAFHAEKINNLPKLNLSWQVGLLVQVMTLTALWLLAI